MYNEKNPPLVNSWWKAYGILVYLKMWFLAISLALTSSKGKQTAKVNVSPTVEATTDTTAGETYLSNFLFMKSLISL